MTAKICSIQDCTTRAICRGWCKKHYKRWLAHGDPMTYRPKTAEKHAWIDSAVAYVGDDCLEWPWSRTTSGYGNINFGGRRWAYVHRVVLERVAGPPPEGRPEAGHAPRICHNRACANPRHLRWVSRKENAQDIVIDGSWRNQHAQGRAS